MPVAGVRVPGVDACPGGWVAVELADDLGAADTVPPVDVLDDRGVLIGIWFWAAREHVAYRREHCGR